jgi:hypothetical protein
LPKRSTVHADEGTYRSPELEDQGYQWTDALRWR